MLSDGSYGTIDSIGIEVLLEPEVTYNFEVADYHTYYVGECNVLVHNRCKFYEANKVGNNYEIGKEITKKQALNRLRNNKSVWTTSRASAKSLAKKIGVKGKAMRHVNHNVGYYKHFHDGIHLFDGHVFYGKPVS